MTILFSAGRVGRLYGLGVGALLLRRKIFACIADMAARVEGFLGDEGDTSGRSGAGQRDARAGGSPPSEGKNQQK
uniref:Uncharacterized protein n=1 Tax=Aquisalinus luteolus TaxID=1566827 RepID=A0A8J3A0E3_9PROT|nr:hypothetical protein GCM10011355_02400 [Aquisalinus luteolus]